MFHFGDWNVCYQLDWCSGSGSETESLFEIFTFFPHLFLFYGGRSVYFREWESLLLSASNEMINSLIDWHGSFRVICVLRPFCCDPIDCCLLRFYSFLFCCVFCGGITLQMLQYGMHSLDRCHDYLVEPNIDETVIHDVNESFHSNLRIPIDIDTESRSLFRPRYISSNDHHLYFWNNTSSPNTASIHQGCDAVTRDGGGHCVSV